MDSSGEDINDMVEKDDAPKGPSGQKETSTADMLRFHLLCFVLFKCFIRNQTHPKIDIQDFL